MRKNAIIVLLGIGVLYNLSGCANLYSSKMGEEAGTKITNLGYVFDKKPVDCPIEVLNNTKPTKEYIVVANLESHFVYGALTSATGMADNIKKELVKQACLLGGDAVIVKDVIDSKANESNISHIWSTVVKYK